MEEVCLCDVEDPVDVSGPNVAMSAVQVERTNLSKCCKRLDESVTQQRKYANKVTRLNYKIQDYRYRSATSLDMISHVAAADLSNFDSYEFSPLHSCRSEMWDVNSDLTYFTMTAHLNDERKINEEYCAQLDKERRRNLRLQQEIEHLRHKIESNTRENEKALQLHDMNIARKEEENRRKMNDVKSDLESVRRQLSDLTRQSTKDMEKQKADFFQLLTEISDVLRHHQWANTHV
ncbi:hypothetical protein AB6A40_010774 [Gnathostoma spinigerum]|uniref:Rootletin-like coiled-coil domain-containing protein n=1 Tax=Gnathostoma spinigerum TaxID=75299 RepID=A0ABD6EVU9_9BILA